MISETKINEPLRLENVENHEFYLIPIETWSLIFSSLDTENLLTASMTCKKWNSILKSDDPISIWKNCFFKNFHPTIDFKFPSWKEAVVNHFHWGKEIRIRPPISYSEKGIKFSKFIDSKRILVEGKHFLQILHLDEYKMDGLFTLPIRDFKDYGERIIGLFDQGFAIWTKRDGSILAFLEKKNLYPIFNSNKSFSTKISSDHLKDACIVNSEDNIYLGDKLINISCIKEDFQPTLYAHYPEEDLFLVGCFPGRVQLYHSDKLIFDYQEKHAKYIFHLSLFEEKIVIGYQENNLSSFSFEKQLVIYDKKNKHVIKKIFIYSLFTLNENSLFYSNKDGDLKTFDLNTLIENTVFSTRNCYSRIKKVLHKQNHIWILCSNGQLYLHHLLTQKSISVRETKCVGVMPRGLDIFSIGNYLILIEESWSNPCLEVFNTEDLDHIQLMNERKMDSPRNVFSFGKGLVFDYENSIKILKDPSLNELECLNDTVDCIVKEDRLIVSFNNGNIVFFDTDFLIVKEFQLGLSIVHANVFQDYLLYIDTTGKGLILDIASQDVIFEKEHLFTFVEDEILPSFESLFGNKEIVEPIKSFSRIFSEGIITGDVLIIAVDHAILAVNIKSKQSLFENEAFSEAVKFLPSEEEVFCLDESNKIMGKIKPETLVLEKMAPHFSIKDIIICYDQFLLKFQSNGIIEVIDLISGQKKFEWNQQIDFCEKFEIHEISENKIIFTYKDVIPILYNLLTGEQEILENQPLFSWNLISKDLLLMVLNNGKVISLDLKTGMTISIHKIPEDCCVKSAQFKGKKITISYEFNNPSLDAQSNQRAIFLDLEMDTHILIAEDNTNLQLGNCYLLNDEGKMYLFYSLFNEYYDYSKYYYKFLDLKDKKLIFEFKSFSHCTEWIKCTDQYLLYLDERGAVFACDKSGKETLLLDSKYVERRSLVEKQVIEGKVFVWFEEEEPYDSDGNAPSFGPSCYIFDPNDFSFVEPSEGIYKNEKKLLMVVKNDDYFLLDSNNLSIEISLNRHNATTLYCNNDSNRIILGIDETKSNGYDDNDSIQEFCLQIWDLKEKILIDSLKNQRGQISNIYSFDFKTYILITNSYSDNHGQEKKLLVISEDISNPQEIDLSKSLGEESHLREIKFIENKGLIHCDQFLYLLNIKTQEIIEISRDCEDFQIVDNYIFIESKDGLDISKITFHDLLATRV